MSKVLRRSWPANLEAGMARRDRKSCVYAAYIPDPLVGRRVRLDGDVAADVADAERAIGELNSPVAALADTEALARLLLRAESVASSYIEGLVIGGRRLLRAEAARALGERGVDVTAEEVLGNIEAMTAALEIAQGTQPIRVDDLLAVHDRLVARTRLRDHGGRIREVQNWIGGNSFNPCSAAFVPPPPEYVGDLLQDLCAFVNREDLPPLVQAAIAHAQFETIHPFIDGNGRTGRALIHLILRRRGIVPKAVPPISLVLATWSQSYVEGLTATRYIASPDSAEAHSGTNQWVALFSAACRRAVEDALSFESQVERIQQDWRRALGAIRAGSAVERLVTRLPGVPVITVTGASGLIGVSFQATNAAVARLATVGVVEQVSVGRRNRAFEARAIIDAFNALERRLASPTGETRSAPPGRPVPTPSR